MEGLYCIFFYILYLIHGTLNPKLKVLGVCPRGFRVSVCGGECSGLLA